MRPCRRPLRLRLTMRRGRGWSRSRVSIRPASRHARRSSRSATGSSERGRTRPAAPRARAWLLRGSIRARGQRRRLRRFRVGTRPRSRRRIPGAGCSTCGMEPCAPSSTRPTARPPRWLSRLSLAQALRSSWSRPRRSKMTRRDRFAFPSTPSAAVRAPAGGHASTVVAGWPSQRLSVSCEWQPLGCGSSDSWPTPPTPGRRLSLRLPWKPSRPPSGSGSRPCSLSRGRPGRAAGLLQTSASRVIPSCNGLCASASSSSWPRLPTGRRPLSAPGGSAASATADTSSGTPTSSSCRSWPRRTRQPPARSSDIASNASMLRGRRPPAAGSRAPASRGNQPIPARM